MRLRLNLLSLLAASLCTFTAAPLFAQHGLGGGERKWTPIEWAQSETAHYVIEYEKGIARSTVSRIGSELEDALELARKHKKPILVGISGAET